MKKNNSISLESVKWDALQVEAEKRGVSRNELFDVMTDALLQNQPIISEVVDLDKQIKIEKLEHEKDKHKKTIEQTIYLKNTNEYFSEHGFYPSKPANYVKQVVEQKPTQEQKVWYGSSYGQDRKSEPPKQNFIESMPKKELTPEQLEWIYSRHINELSSGKFSCGVCCVAIFAESEDVKRHLHDVHGGELHKTAKEFGLTL